MVPNFMDEVDCGNFFDQIDDLIEFPPEINECGGGDLAGSADFGVNFPSMWNNALPDSDPLFTGSNGNVESDLLSELFVPHDDNVQLEWLSTFVDNSFSSRGTTPGKEIAFSSNEPSHNQFQASSPISVLESSSNSNSRGLHRARTKRPHPLTFAPRLISASLSSIDNPLQAENFAESAPMKKFPEVAREESRKKKVKMTFARDPIDNHHEKCPVEEVRRCKHCGITKTPQWRLGPMGPKTLCNACGVRHKSGRLFPEYRPAASPTFVPSLHSNSHKKVLEIRSKVEPVKSEFVPTISP